MNDIIAKTWFITGASRGLGAEMARAALDAGDRVVATARSRQALIDRLGPESSRFLPLAVDVTDRAQIARAVEVAVQRFVTIDVLVNNAGFGHLGVFEETRPEDAHAQFATNVFGLFDVTRAVLPVMRAQRSGRIFNISSIGGLRGGESGALYCASKFAVEGFSESLAAEVAGFGVRVTIVEPGFFRTDFLDPASVRFAPPSIPDYAELSAALRAFYEGRSHNQAGDPARLAGVMVYLAHHEDPPLRFCAGSDAVAVVEAKIDQLGTELDAWREVSVSTDGDYAPTERPRPELVAAWG